jgi:hypothetical protein
VRAQLRLAASGRKPQASDSGLQVAGQIANGLLAVANPSAYGLWPVARTRAEVRVRP